MSKQWISYTHCRMVAVIQIDGQCLIETSSPLHLESCIKNKHLNITIIKYSALRWKKRYKSTNILLPFLSSGYQPRNAYYLAHFVCYIYKWRHTHYQNVPLSESIISSLGDGGSSWSCSSPMVLLHCCTPEETGKVTASERKKAQLYHVEYVIDPVDNK